MRIALAAFACLISPAGGCASITGSVFSDADRCAAISEVAKSQYEFGLDRPLPLYSESYGTTCDWESHGLATRIIGYEDLDAWEGLFVFEKPRQEGDVMVVRAVYSGPHLYARQCRVRRDGEGWRLVRECPIEEYRH